MSSDDRRTTISIFASDLARLQALQQRVSADQGKWITMSDLIRSLLNASETAGEGA